MKMKKLAFVATVVVMLALMSGVAFAESPHGPFGDSTALCAACHRTHTAMGEYLLSATGITGVCITCHEAGHGADADVVNGTYIAGSETVPTGPPAGIGSGYGDGVVHPLWGTNNGVLMGGGFEFIGTGAGSAVTSKHFNVDTRALIFGYTLGTGTLGVGGTIQGQDANSMDCVDCHIPHSSTNYRMLRLKPNGTATDINVAYNLGDISNPATNRKYTEDTGLYNVSLPDVAGGTAGNEGISAWCAACHTYYYNGVASNNAGSQRTALQIEAMTGTYYDMGGTAAADKTYMHAVDADLLYSPRNGGTQNNDLSPHLSAAGAGQNKLPVAASTMVGYDANDAMTCLTCHRSHGTNVTMDGAAATSRTLKVPTGGTGTDVTISGANASVLLRLTNRGVCETCHDMSAGF